MYRLWMESDFGQEYFIFTSKKSALSWAKKAYNAQFMEDVDGSPTIGEWDETFEEYVAGGMVSVLNVTVYSDEV